MVKTHSYFLISAAQLILNSLTIGTKGDIIFFLKVHLARTYPDFTCSGLWVFNKASSAAVPRGHTEFKVTPHSHQQVNYNFIFKHTDCMLVSTPNDLTCLIFLLGGGVVRGEWSTRSKFLSAKLKGHSEFMVTIHIFNRLPRPKSSPPNIPERALSSYEGSREWGMGKERVGKGRRAMAPDLGRSEKFSAHGHLGVRVLAGEERPGNSGWSLAGVSRASLDDCITASGQSKTGSEAACVTFSLFLHE